MGIAPALSQSGRTGKFHSPLGGDTLVLTAFAGDEGINYLGQFRVDAMSALAPIDLNDCLGKNATVEIRSLAHGPRFLDGVVVEGEFLGMLDNRDGVQSWHYRFTLRPWFWLAGLRRNQRIFHKQTAPEIIAEVLADYADFETDPQIIGDFPVLEYTVQYRETDLAFVSRMCERFGISWYFRHELGRHVMVLANHPDAYPEAPGVSRPFRSVKGHHQRAEEHFSRWQAGRRVTTGRVTLTDYNFKSPDASMLTEASAAHPYAQGTIESFDYPGDYLNESRGKKVVQLRTRQGIAADATQSADGDTVSLTPGMVVELAEHPDQTIDGRAFVVMRVDHHYEGEHYRSGTGSRSGSDGYRGHFRLYPHALPLVPERITPRATVAGPQTATVVGEDEIDCDEYGRILVRFHWDRDEKISMRCRVSQSWAGAGWGGMVIPRVGMEVIVEFLEGDPDQPIVTGCVYNGKNDPPYNLPANKTRATWKSKTHNGVGYNELRFEDANGDEELFMHAQKNFNTITLNDQSHVINNNRSKTIGSNQSESIGANNSITIGQNHVETIGVSATYTIGSFVTHTVGITQSNTYGRDLVQSIGNILQETIGTDHAYEVGGNFVGQVAGDYAMDVGSSITVNTGKHVLMAFEEFEIAGPGGKITIGPSGIKIEAPKIDLVGMVSMGGMGMAQVEALSLAAKDALPLCEECPKEES